MSRGIGRRRRGVALTLAWIGMATLGLAMVRVGEFVVSDGVFFGVGVVVVVQLLTGDSSGLAPARSRRSSQLVLVGSILLLTAGTLSSFGSWNPAGSLLVVARVGYLTLVWFWILRAVTPTRAAVDVLLSGWRAGVVFVATVAVLDQFGIISVSAENSENRQTAFSGHPNDLAGFLVVALPMLALGLPRRPERSRRRDMASRFLVTGLALYAITTTGSMTGLASAAVAGVVTLGILVLVPSAQRRAKPRSPLAIMAAILVGLIGLGLLVTSDLPVFERIERYESGDSYVTGSADLRRQLNERVIGNFDDWLVAGVGLDSESVFATGLLTERIDGGVHNMYLKILLEAGLPGLVGLLLILGATLRAAFLLVVNTRRTDLYPVAVVSTASSITACTFANFGPILFHRYFWLPAGLVWCLWALRREELRQASDTGPVHGPAVRPQASGT
jgi:O-antigen ligase